ncbi:MAG TPA: hypothetical protein VH681_02245 [Nitrospiraceae bacterium]|jgi:hypothetical protein
MADDIITASPVQRGRGFDHDSLSRQCHQLVTPNLLAYQSIHYSVPPVTMNDPLQKQFRPIDLAAISTAPPTEPKRIL